MVVYDPLLDTTLDSRLQDSVVPTPGWKQDKLALCAGSFGLGPDKINLRCWWKSTRGSDLNSPTDFGWLGSWKLWHGWRFNVPL